MTTPDMINLIRASRATLTHRVLVAIADRLEEQHAYLKTLLARVDEQETQLRALGGRVADLERENHGLIMENGELHGRCEQLGRDLIGSERQVREACAGLARVMYDLDQLRLEMELTT